MWCLHCSIVESNRYKCDGGFCTVVRIENSSHVSFANSFIFYVYILMLEMAKAQFISLSLSFFLFSISKLIDRRRRQRCRLGRLTKFTSFPFFIIFSAIAVADHHIHYTYTQWRQRRNNTKPLLVRLACDTKLHVLPEFISRHLRSRYVRFSGNYYAIFSIAYIHSSVSTAAIKQ